MDDGYTMLDIVKHAVNAVMNMLGEDDRVSLVTFHSRVDRIFPLT